MAGHTIAASDPRWKTAGQYNAPMAALAQEVEKWDEFATGRPNFKPIHLLGEIEKMVSSDEEWLDSKAAEGLNRHAPQQHIDEMRTLLQKGHLVAEQIVEAYDNMNSAFLRMGLK
jgi:hypothetical protein